jgi:hypothetical protein
MGGRQSVADDRIQRCAEMLELSRADIDAFNQCFRRKDFDNKGFITIPAFFELIGEPNSIIGRAIFELM